MLEHIDIHACSSEEADTMSFGSMTFRSEMISEDPEDKTRSCFCCRYNDERIMEYVQMCGFFFVLLTQCGET